MFVLLGVVIVSDMTGFMAPFSILTHTTLGRTDSNVTVVTVHEREKLCPASVEPIAFTETVGGGRTA